MAACPRPAYICFGAKDPATPTFRKTWTGRDSKSMFDITESSRLDMLPEPNGISKLTPAISSIIRGKKRRAAGESLTRLPSA